MQAKSYRARESTHNETRYHVAWDSLDPTWHVGVVLVDLESNDDI